MGKIIVSGKTYTYKPVPIYLGKKRIDSDISKSNLLDFQKIMQQKNLSFSLAYGTLLGAIRDNNFIEHDEDVDINMLNSDRDAFFKCLFELRELGFEVARYDKRGLLSIIRNNEYIDIYFFSKVNYNVYECGGNFLLEKWLTELLAYPFLGSNFMIPKDYLAFLEFEYGQSWKQPIAYSHSSFQILVSRLALLVKKIIPDQFMYYLLDLKNRQKRKIILARLKQIE